MILKCCSLNDPYDGLGCSLSWQPGESLQMHEREERPLKAAPNILVLLVAVTEQSATPSLDTSPSEHDTAKGKLVPENEVEETMFRLLEPFSEDVVDDDAAHFRKSLSA